MPEIVVVREVSAPTTIKVVAVGPQGPVGTVNPLMFALRDEAQASAGAAALSEAAAGASEQAAASSEANAAASANAALASEQAADVSESNAAASAAGALFSANSASDSAMSASLSSDAAAQSAADAAASALVAADAAPVQSVAGRIGDVVLTKDDVGLSNVDNTPDATKVVLKAGGLTTPRLLTVSGDASGSAALDWSGDQSISITLANSGVDAGTYNNSATAVAPLVIDAKGRVIGIGAPVTITPSWLSVTNKPTTADGYGLTDVVLTSSRGVANGVATLDGSGLIPLSQLPSYVDDVQEFASLAAFPVTGEAGKIYVALDTNKTYRWSGSAYVEISPSPGTTDSLTEGATNLYFTTARARAALSATGAVSYNAATGVISAELTSGYASKTISANTTLNADTEYETGRNLRVNHGIKLTVPNTTLLIVRKYAAGSSL